MFQKKVRDCNSCTILTSGKQDDQQRDFFNVIRIVISEKTCICTALNYYASDIGCI